MCGRAVDLTASCCLLLPHFDDSWQLQHLQGPQNQQMVMMMMLLQLVYHNKMQLWQMLTSLLSCLCWCCSTAAGSSPHTLSPQQQRWLHLESRKRRCGTI